MTTTLRRRASFRPDLLLIALVLALAGGLLFGSTPARADTPPNSISHRYLNVSEPSLSQQRQYDVFLQSFREAVGNTWHYGVFQTQTGGAGLVRVTINFQGRGDLGLWFTPGDMYLHGFTDSAGHTFQMQGWNLRAFIEGMPAAVQQQHGYTPNGGGTLTFEGDYQSLSSAANRSREDMPYSFADFQGSWEQLFNANNNRWTSEGRRATARSLMFFTQFISESARLNDVRGMSRYIMFDWGARYAGIPARQRSLENYWGTLSSWAQAAWIGPTPSLDVPNVGHLYATSQAIDLLYTLKTDDNPNTLPPPGHDEL